MQSEYKVIGTNHAPKDLLAKITGRARYAEDFRVEGMAFAKLLLSPMPHARVVSIDARAALAMDGVYGILTADDLQSAAPAGGRGGLAGRGRGGGDGDNQEGGDAEPPGGRGGRGAAGAAAGRGGGAAAAADDGPSGPGPEQPLTNEPMFQGQPIAAIAAVDETTAAEAIDRLRVQYEPLPFVLDSYDALRPGGPSAHAAGNAYVGNSIGELRWTAEQIAAVERGEWPEGVETSGGWEYGDVDAALAESALVITEPIFHQSQTHHPLEPRSALAYWQNGKCYLHCSTQSVMATRAGRARAIGIPPEDLVLISEFCGGGFGSKITGTITDTIPALFSRKIGRPVMMRITREEETYIGRARTGLQGFVRIGFRPNGRVAAIDLLLIQDNGPYGRQGDAGSAANEISLSYQPETMRFRQVVVLTNTPPRSAQRAPGGLQGIAMVGPLVTRGARELGLDPLDVLYVNAPSGRAPMGQNRGAVTSAFVREAIEAGRAAWNYDEKRRMSRQVNGTKITGVGVAVSSYSSGSRGYDGLMIIRPDGRLYIYQGVGNLGSNSVMDTAMVAAEVLGIEWDDNIEVIWGDTSRGLPNSSIQAGSQTTHAHTRANYATAVALKEKLQRLAARELGGSPENYEVGGGRVYRRGSPGTGLTFARAAERAIELGGEFDGSTPPDGINAITRTAVAELAGQGLLAAARDNFGGTGSIKSYVASFCMVEVDRETGVVTVKDYYGSVDCGTVINPRNLEAQTLGGGLQGMSVARFERWAFDPRWGVNSNKRFYTAKPITILDAPIQMAAAGVNIPDPTTPVGARGIGEPAIGAGAAAFIDAVADALGTTPNRIPLTPDRILSILEGLEPSYSHLQTHV